MIIMIFTIIAITSVLFVFLALRVLRESKPKALLCSLLFLSFLPMIPRGSTASSDCLSMESNCDYSLLFFGFVLYTVVATIIIIFFLLLRSLLPSRAIGRLSYSCQDLSQGSS